MKTTILASMTLAALAVGAVAEEAPQRERGERPQRGERGERPDRGERPQRGERGGDPAAMFDRLDTEEQGFLTLENFLANPRFEQARDPEAAREMAKQRFAAMDKNEDGRVTREEFVAHAQAIREQMRERLGERAGERGGRRGGDGEGRQRPQRPSGDN